MNAPLLELRGITKDYPGARALDGVSFDVRAGEVHALVGENGAGKSTLVKVLSGVIPHGQFAGEVVLDGVARRFAGVRAAERAGIAVIHQELALVPRLSVAENVFLGAERLRAPGIVDWERTHAEAAAALARVGLRVHPATPVAELGVGERQMVEIARALAREARLIVLDEPTAALTGAETDTLLARLADLRARGVAAIYISHRLREVARIADRITVLRDGRTVCTDAAAALPEAALIRHMVGRDVARRPYRPHAPGAVALEVRGWSVADRASGRVLVRDVSFTARRGEIVGLAGLMGAGRTELVMSLFGAWGEPVAGTVALDGALVRIRDPRAAIAHGLALVTEDRKRDGLVPGLDVRRNSTLASLPRFARFGVLDHAAENAAAARLAAELRTRAHSLEQLVSTLSGGNQQKVILARWLLTEPKVLFLDEPTRGIDVGARAEIEELVHALARRGVAIVLVSSDLPEVLGLSDRVLVMRNGRVVAELAHDEADEETVMRYATGAADAPVGAA